MGMSLMQFALPHFATDVSFCASPEQIAFFVRTACAADADIFEQSPEQIAFFVRTACAADAVLLTQIYTFAAWLLPPALCLFLLVWLVPGSRYQPFTLRFPFWTRAQNASGY